MLRDSLPDADIGDHACGRLVRCHDDVVHVEQHGLSLGLVAQARLLEDALDAVFGFLEPPGWPLGRYLWNGNPGELGRRTLGLLLVARLPLQALVEDPDPLAADGSHRASIWYPLDRLHLGRVEEVGLVLQGVVRQIVLVPVFQQQVGVYVALEDALTGVGADGRRRGGGGCGGATPSGVLLGLPASTLGGSDQATRLRTYARYVLARSRLFRRPIVIFWLRLRF